jgi:PAS domain-containing protein
LEKKLAQEHKQVQLLAKALEQTDDMVLITDANGIIEYINDSVIHKTGYQKSELIGKKQISSNQGSIQRIFIKNYGILFYQVKIIAVLL